MPTISEYLFNCIKEREFRLSQTRALKEFNRELVDRPYIKILTNQE